MITLLKSFFYDIFHRSPRPLWSLSSFPCSICFPSPVVLSCITITRVFADPSPPAPAHSLPLSLVRVFLFLFPLYSQCNDNIPSVCSSSMIFPFLFRFLFRFLLSTRRAVCSRKESEGPIIIVSHHCIRKSQCHKNTEVLTSRARNREKLLIAMLFG